MFKRMLNLFKSPTPTKRMISYDSDLLVSSTDNIIPHLYKCNAVGYNCLHKVKDEMCCSDVDMGCKKRADITEGADANN